MAAAAPVYATLAVRVIVRSAEPLAVGLDPIHDIGGSRIGLNAASFTPFVDLYLLDLDLHELVHAAIVSHFFEKLNRFGTVQSI
jgi:hypothetical protein